MTHEQFLKKLGTHIFCIRKSRGISQAQLAEKSGLSINTISNIERGVVNFKATDVLVITRALKDKLSRDFG